MGDDGLFEEYGVADATDVVNECTCCGDETKLTTGTQKALPLPYIACVNSEERSVDFKRWRELMDTGISINYRCIRCRAFNNCRNADQTEKVSLRQDA